MSGVDVLIVGGGHAGAQAAISLRQLGFAGGIEVVSSEPDIPYERPPLSKDYLTGGVDFETLLIRPNDFWIDRKVTMTLSTEVVAVEPKIREVVLDDGRRLTYEALIWAAGGRPRLLGCEGEGFRGVHTLRSRTDIDRLKAELDSSRAVVVVGGGYIGLEVAAAIRASVASVILLEAQDRLLSRVSAEPVSSFFEQAHRAGGVDMRFGASVEAFVGHNGEVVGVRLADGSVLACDVAIVGVGLVPNVELLAAAGARIANGVVVDSFCRTTLPGVFAIGDCAAHPNPFAGGDMVRLESVQNATDQAITVARFVTGSAEPYAAPPWFWSTQYDLKMQTIGLSHGHDSIVLRGTPANRSFSVVYLRQGEIIALDCINAVKDYVQGRAWVAGSKRPDLAALANVEVSLKAVPSVP